MRGVVHSIVVSLVVGLLLWALIRVGPVVVAPVWRWLDANVFVSQCSQELEWGSCDYDHNL